MMYRIIITGDIKRQLQMLPGYVKPITRQQIAALASQPRPQRSKELAGHTGHYRLHIATHFRLVWLVDDQDGVVEIEYIGPKTPNLYDTLGLARPSPPTDS